MAINNGQTLQGVLTNIRQAAQWERDKGTAEVVSEDASRFTVNGKSAIEWLIDHYQENIEKDSQILNDPNL